MAMTINTNVVSLNAQRNLSLSGGSLSTTMQRLSSGLRVNSAKDDAAGLAISERMRAQSAGLSVAARNANDGISLAQTTEGALGKIGDMLQRQRELAVQSSNATNSDSDRAALQSELSQLTSEIDRVAKTTSFNGTKVLDGSFSGGVFQVGSNAGDNITVQGTTKATADGLGSATYGSTSSVGINAANIKDFDKALSGMSMEVGGKTIDLNDVKAAASGEARLGQMVSAINEKTADTGVTAFLAKGAKDGEFTISLKSSSEGAVLLKGFDSLAGEAKVTPAVPSKLDFSAMQTAVDAFNKTAGNTDTKANAEKVLEALNAQIANASGYDAGGNHAAGSIAAKMASVAADIETVVNDAPYVAADVKSELTNLDANAWTKADTATLNPPAVTSKLAFNGATADGIAKVAAIDAADLATLTKETAEAALNEAKTQAKLATGYNADGVSTGVAKQLLDLADAITNNMTGAPGALDFVVTGGDAGLAAQTAIVNAAKAIGSLVELKEQDTYAANAGTNPSQLSFTATENALDDFSVDKSFTNAKAVVDALNAQIAKASGDANSGVQADLQKTVDALNATFNTAVPPDNFGAGGAEAFVNALKDNGVSLTGLAAVKAADEAALNPVTKNEELQAKIDTVMKLNGESSVVDVNKALKELNTERVKAGQEEFDALDINAKPAEVETALKGIQDKLDTLGLNIGGTEVAKHKGIDTLDISTQDKAWEAIKQIDSAIDQVNSARGDLGALQTRFEKTVENIDIQNENISAAKGRIVDADFAVETANLSRAQILQQAGTAMVAQANQLPQSVLSLLR